MIYVFACVDIYHRLDRFEQRFYAFDANCGSRLTDGKHPDVSQIKERRSRSNKTGRDTSHL